MRRALLSVLLVLVCAPAPAMASETVDLRATLTPERLGRDTTIGFNIQITAPDGQAPSPLTDVEVRYPKSLGIALSELGLETCSAAVLETIGATGCPINSRIGFGSAVAEVPFEPDPVRAKATIRAFRAPDREGHLAFFFYTESITPVLAQLILPSLLLPAAPPFGGSINVAVPLVPSLPQGADVSVVQLEATIGPEHILYTERVHGRTVEYKPRGILLPNKCPRGGFRFAATLSFMDGSRTTAGTKVPCPRHKTR